MKLREQAIIQISISFVIFFIVLYFTSKTILLRSFISLEKQDFKDNMNRVLYAITDSADNLEATTTDYSSWDQTYGFIESRNKEFIESEFTDDTLKNIRVNLLIILNKSGDVVYNKAFDIQKQEEIKMSRDIEKEIINNKAFLSNVKDGKGVTGIISLDKGPMIISFKPILKSDGTGPSRGVLVMGRYLDSAEVRRIKEITNLQFNIKNIDNSSVVKELIEIKEQNNDNPEVLIKNINTEKAYAYAILDDINGKPAITVELDINREIYKQGILTIRYFIWAFLILIIINLIAALISLNKFLLSRILKLTRDVGNIGASGDFSSRLKLEGKDEITILTNSINGMLEKLEDSMDELRINNEKLKELDKLKTDFLSTVSHELRTPLTSILGFAKIIKKKMSGVILSNLNLEDKKVEKSAKQITENIDIIVSEGERLTSLINDVLDIAKMESGKIELKLQSLSISDVINRAISATTSLSMQKGLRIEKDIEENLPNVTGDMDRLIQVVINLISNSVKFTDSGLITCRVRKSDNKIIVSIIDTGVGIARKDFDKVFEKFKQVGDTLTNKPKGTGLGLPICKQIIEYHGGNIWVESELGQGSKFSFSIPLDTVVKEAETNLRRYVYAKNKA